MEISIKSIALGKAKKYKFGKKEFESGYKKDNFLEEIEVSSLGLLGDNQVDKRFHGGIDKAIHFGSTTHLKENSNFDKLFIGCNILIDNHTEEDIFIGDIYQIGEIEVEVSQPRQPCWKIGALFGKEMSRYISKNHATGWYVRVLKEGKIKISDKMILKKRVSNISIKDLSIYLKVPPEERAIIDEILNLEAIATSYKKDFLATLERNNS
ncbi:MOSC domain-containing protein [Arcobacter arenosus]|uniref:MOSC domain-containing protein n=1 Tax=Arcobacter arenosus TaxID=2576037 RepID=A0A5R8Y262_9BACT|nr:MOSC domain-containing protein [Arcobacter arenosus]TLP39372.1 MOSC domain-containing protein [Arcobacter arenosus]